MPGKGGENMPIKWSAVKVVRAMDEVEHQVALAEDFIAEAKTRAGNAKGIANLPSYLDQKLNRLIFTIERIESVKDAIKGVRDAIPDGAVEAEQKRTRYGQQQGLV